MPVKGGLSKGGLSKGGLSRVGTGPHEGRKPNPRPLGLQPPPTRTRTTPPLPTAPPASRTYADAPTAMLWATLPAVLSYYGMPADGPQSTAVKGGFADLGSVTDPNWGLMAADPGRWATWRPSR